MTMKTLNGWGWPLTLGILFIISGLILLSAPVVATLVTIVFVGVFLVIYGIIYLISSLFDRHDEYFWLYLFVAILMLIMGALILVNPKITLLSVTFLIGGLFL